MADCRKRVPVVAAGLALVLVWAGALVAAAEPTREIDPKAEALLRTFADHIDGAEQLAVEARIAMHLEFQGQSMDNVIDQRLSLQRPSRFVLESRNEANEAGDTTITSDGEQFLVVVHGTNQYLLNDSPPTTGEIGPPPSRGGAFFLIAMPLNQELLPVLLEGFDRVEYVGSEEHDGASLHHINLTSASAGLEVWLEDQAPHLLRRAKPDMEKMLAGLRNEGRGDIKNDTLVEFKTWNFEPEFAADRFVVTPPEGAERIEVPSANTPERPKLLGQEAPELKLENLAGETIDLASHKGNEVVILDFWATWCGPCRVAMPVIAEAAAKFAEQGVVFYAVNLREEADDIEKFLAAEELEIEVLLDRDGKVGERYGATAIPQTVIVGKDGRVQVVHIGALPDLGEQLKRELTALVAGEDLATQALEASQEAPADGESK